MQLNLTPHPSTLPAKPSFKIWANVDHVASLGAIASTNIWFCVGAPIDRFAVSEPSEPERVDGLWNTTCFEAFFRPPGRSAYREWDFATSGNWAAYDFTGYRKKMKDAEVRSPPYIRLEDNFTWWALGATIAVKADENWEFGLSAVLEEKDGTKSYWALAHAAGEKPDFHAPDCFAAKLP
ncbi:MAG: DOMON-like domain-containing protein [Sphingomicrobium sp.]